ncbi:MAG TPA: HAMP domain-containing sensor histidine kinase [Dehalococcoidia bacterium]
MNLRARLTVLVALCVAGAVVVVSVLAYVTTRDRLVSTLDETLQGRAQFVGGGPGAGSGPPPDNDGPDEDDRPGLPSIDVFQVVKEDGSVAGRPSDQSVVLPVSDRDLRVAARNGGPYFHDVSVDGDRYRVYTAPGQSGEAVLVARSLGEIDGTLEDLRNILIAISVAGVAVATLLGLIVAHRSLRPISRLTAAAEHVAATQDLSHSIDASGRDEIGRLAASFNTMLRELDASRQQQRRLVSDASHELRTPLTSLRTNVELLARDDDLDPEKRAILHDATVEIGELTKIVSELVDLAIDPRTEEREQLDVRLDEIAESVVERARRRSKLAIELDTEPTLVVGNPDLLERAVTNLVDNACKWSPPDATITVTLRAGRLAVADAGPGISADDLPHVFERFYRSDDARSKPGSGLGLAIVKQVIEAHGGEVHVESAVGAGTVVSFVLPTIDPGSIDTDSA